jgi:periplasmic protein TorT
MMLRWGLCCLLLPLPLAAEPWRLEVRTDPFDYSSPAVVRDYDPLDKAAQHWTFCVSLPHMKDAYYLSFNYGMVEEARRLGVGFRLLDAGGYPNLDRQIEQITQCVSEGADALIVATVSFEGLTPALRSISERIPVIGAVNDIADEGITAKAAVSWYDMGHAAGEVVAARHPKGTPPVDVAWFPGPEGAGWVRFVDSGFRDAIAGSSASVVVTRYGDTGREIQVLLVEEVLENHPQVDYLVGSAPMAEAAVSILRSRGLSDSIGIVSDYMTHAVYRALRRGRIIAAPTDFPVLQGRLAIEMAVRAVEQNLSFRHAGPRIQLVTPQNVHVIGPEGSLAPPSFVPTFVLE